MNNQVRIPCDLRRTTMIVNDINPYLEIYHEIFGMQVHYDDQLVLQGNNLPVGEAGKDNTVRLVMLKANHDYVGMLGVLQYLDPPLSPVPSIKEKLFDGDAVHLFNVNDAAEIHKKVSRVKGVRVMSDLNEQEYPNPNDIHGKPFKLKGFNFFDPNGYFIVCNQWIYGNPRPANMPNNTPCDLRRTTMLLNDNSTALQIYKDILKLEIQYSQKFEQTDKTFPVSNNGSVYEVDTTFLKSNHDYIGMLGLETFISPSIEKKVQKDRLGIGDIVFVFNVEDADYISREIKKIDGIRIVADVHVSEYPNPNDKDNPYVLKGINFFDPSGQFIECNQWVK